MIPIEYQTDLFSHRLPIQELTIDKFNHCILFHPNKSDM